MIQSQTFIAQNESISLPSNNNLSFIFQDQINIPIEKSEQPEGLYNNTKTNQNFLRFNTINSSLAISQTGLICTNVDPKGAKGIAISSQGFTTGVHYWEFNCPKSCEDIQVGIVMKDFDINVAKTFTQSPTCHPLEFKTTTSRTIGLRLDLDRGIFRCWLNGNLHEKKGVGIIQGEKLLPGMWYPFVSVKTAGNQVILNPFAQDPEYLLPLYQLPQLIPIGQIPNRILQLKNQIQYAPEQQRNQINKTYQSTVVANKQKYAFIKIQSNLAILYENKLKILSTAMKDNFVLLRDQEIKTIQDEVTLQIPLQNLMNLLEYPVWIECCLDEQLSEVLLNSLKNGYKIKNIYLFKTSYFNGRMILSHSINYFYSQIDKLNKIQQDIFNGRVELKNEVKVEDQAIQELKKLTQDMQADETPSQQESKTQITLNLQPSLQSLEELYTNLQTLLSLDEQIVAMSLQGEDNTFQCKNRIFTAFGRLGSFCDSVPNDNVVRLANEGFFKKPGYNFELGMFNKPREDIELLDYQMELQGRMRVNIQLDQTINNSPALNVQNSELIQNKVDSSFIGTLSNEQVYLYNAEIQPFNVGSVNLREIGAKPQIKKQHIEVNQKEKQEDIQSDIWRLLENYPSIDLIQQKSPENERLSSLSNESEEQEINYSQIFEDSEVDKNHLQQLNYMGFPLELCYKALIKNKKGGFESEHDTLEAALESLMSETEMPKIQKVKRIRTQRNQEEKVEIKQKETQGTQVQKQEIKQQEDKYAESISFITNPTLSKISNVFLVKGYARPASPLELCTVFTGVGVGPVVTLKRLIYSEKYLRQFFECVDQLNLDKGYVCNLTNECVDTVDLQSMESSLLMNPNAEQIVRTLIPIFGLHQSNYSLRVLEELIIDFERDEVIVSLDYCTRDHSLFLMSVIVKNEEMYMKVHEVNQNDVILHQVIALPSTLNQQIKIHSFSTQTLDSLVYDSIQLFMIKYIIYYQLNRNCIGKHEITQIPLQLQSHIHQALYSDQSIKVIEINKTLYHTHSLQQNTTPQKLSQDNLEEIQQSFKVSQIPFTGNSQKQTLSQNDGYLLHSWSNPTDIEVHLTQPSEIINLDFEVIYASRSPNPYSGKSGLEIFNQQMKVLNTSQAPTKSRNSTTPHILPITVHSFTGSQYNFKTQVTRMIYVNEETFTPNYPKSYFIFRHLHGKRMLPISGTIMSSEKNIQCGFPIGSGLVFSADHPSQFQGSDQFAGMEIDAYWGWLQARASNPAPLKPWEPVGCFQFRNKQEELKFVFDTHRSANYILLRPTNFRRIPYDNSVHFSNNPVEIKLFQIEGVEVDEDNEYYDSFSEGKESYGLKQRFLEDVKVMYRETGQSQYQEVKLNNQNIQADENLIDFLQYDSLGKFSVNQQYDIASLLNDNGISYNSSLRIRLSSPALKNKIIQDIKLEVRKSHQRTNIIHFSLKGNKINQPQIQDQEFDNKLLNMILGEGNHQLRIVAVKLLKQKIQIDKEYLNQCFEQIDLELIIIRILGSLSDQEDQLIYELLYSFQNHQDFDEKLQSAKVKVIKQLHSKLSVSERGLNRFFQILSGGDQYAQVNDYLILYQQMKQKKTNNADDSLFPLISSELYESLFQIESIRNSNQYKALSKMGLYGTYLDSTVFSKKFIESSDQGYHNNIYIDRERTVVHQSIKDIKSKIEAIENQTNQLQYSPAGFPDSLLRSICVFDDKPIPSRIISSTSRNSNYTRTMIVDLLGMYHLRRVYLRFAQHDPLIKCRLQVWALNTNQKALLIDQVWGEWVLHQVASLSYKHPTQNGQNPETVGFPLNTNSRYIQIQLTFGSHAQFKGITENNIIPSKPLVFLPEFEGSLLSQDFTQTVLYEHDSVFRAIGMASPLPTQVINLRGSLNYQKYGTSNLHLLDSTDLPPSCFNEYKLQLVKDQSKSTKIIYEESLKEEVITLLKSYQDQLVSKIMLPDVTIEEIHLEKNSITQLQLLLVDKFSKTLMCFQNLSFLYSYSLKLIGLLQDLAKSYDRQIVFKNQESLTMARQLLLVIEDNIPIFTEARNFLGEFLIETMPMNDWVLFVTEIYDSFDKNGNKYSHLSENLLSLPIPLSETLEYLATVVSCTQDTDYTCCRVLLLLNVLVGWYKKVPSLKIPREQSVAGDSRGVALEQAQVQHGNQLTIAFDVLMWVCDAKLDETVFVALFELASLLIIELVRVRSAQELKLVLLQLGGFGGQQNRFQQIVMSALSYTKSSSQLQQLLERLFISHEYPEQFFEWSRLQVMNEEVRELAVQERDGMAIIKRLMIFQVQSVLQQTVNLNDFHQIRHLQLFIDFLIFSTTKLNVQIKEQNKEKSVQQWSQLISANNQFDEMVQCTTRRQCQLTFPGTTLGLVQYLRNRNCGDFTVIQQIWQIVLELVQRVGTQEIVQQQIIQLLIDAFEKASEEIQQIMLNQMVCLFSNLIQTSGPYLKELSAVIVEVLLSTLDSYLTINNSLRLSLIKGWFNVLMPIKGGELKLLSLHPTSILKLFKYTGQYLHQYGQFGGKDGVHSASPELLSRIELAESMLSLLSMDEDGDETQLQSFFALQEPSTLIPTFTQLIEWSILNLCMESSGSPSLDALEKISRLVWGILESAKSSRQLVQGCLQCAFTIQSLVDSVVVPLMQKEQLSVITTYSIVNRSTKLLQDLFAIWVLDDEIAREVAINGFDFLIRKISGDSQGTEPQQCNRILQLLKTPTQPADNQHNLVAIKSLEDLKEEELANNVKNISLNQQKGVVAPDWSINKKGVKARIFFVLMTGVTQDEYELIIKLDKICEVKNIKIGFQTFSTEFTDKILGAPSSVHVEMGLDQNYFVPMGRMVEIPDESFSQYQVKVFSTNFNQFPIGKATQTLEDKLSSLAQKRVQYIKFRLRRPVITFIEGYSQVQAKNYKNVALGINFLSVIGHNVAKLPTQPHYIQQNQLHCALTLIGQLCSPRFERTLQAISRDDRVLEKVKSNFESGFAKSLFDYEKQLSPLLLAIANNNQKLGDWIVCQLLNTNRDAMHTKLLSEIILQNEKQASVQLFHTFILEQLMKVNSNDGSFTKFVPFIDAYCVVILTSSKNLVNQQSLGLGFNHIKKILYLLNNSCNAQLLIKLLITLIYIPSPYHIVNQQELLYSTLEYVYSAAQDKQEYFQLMAPLVLGSELSIQWLLKSDHLQYFTDRLVEDIGKGKGNLHSQFQFFTALSSVECLREALLRLDALMRIFHAIHRKGNDSIVVQMDADVLALFTQFVFNFIESDETQRELVVHQMIEETKRLATVRDMRFVSQVLVPLLNMERNVFVTVNVWDESRNRFTTDARKLVGKVVNGELSNLLKQDIVDPRLNNISSSMMNATLKSSLNDKLLEVGLNPKNHWELVHNQLVDQEVSSVNKLMNRVFSKAPFLILINGKMAGNQITLGVFSDNTLVPSQNKFGSTQLNQSPNNTFMFYQEGESAEINIKEEVFGQWNIQDDNTMINFMHKQKIVLQLSFNPQESSTFTPYELQEGQEFLFQQAEYWIHKTKKTQQNLNQYSSLTGSIMSSLAQQSTNIPEVALNGYGGLSHLMFPPQYFITESPYNYFRGSPVYTLPSTLHLNQLSQLLNINQMTVSKQQKVKFTSTLTDKEVTLGELRNLALTENVNGIVDLQVNGIEMLQSLVQQQATVIDNPLQMIVFSTFEKQEGVSAIIQVVQSSIKTWKDTVRAAIWYQYIEELSSFCYLPNFFNLFMKNKQFVELLFELLSGGPDQADPIKQKKWDEEEKSSVKFIYQTLVKVLQGNSSEVRETALNRGLLSRILDRVAMVANEKKRVWVEDSEVDQDVQNIATKVDEKDTKKLRKKKGIGYASDNTGQNAKWDTQEYVEKKQQRNEQLKQLLAIIENFFDSPAWHISQETAKYLINTIRESALLPILEAAFRSGSLHMNKEIDLYMGYMKLVSALAMHWSLAPVFMEVPKNYLPKQTESLQILLTNLKGNANIFLNCMTSAVLTTNKEAQQLSSQDMANEIIQAHAAMDKALLRFNGEQSDSEKSDDESANEVQIMSELLRKPLQESYRLLLQDLRFDYISMKDNNRYKHHYSSSIQANYTPSQTKLVRLAQEFADMSTALPIEHTNAIFIRTDKERVDVMKAMVMGAQGTPYAHGAFVFDIYFDDNYPSGPPKMNLSTTGGAKVRFNPNLYSCGKVCLSLLGTWRGNASENWDPKISTLLQVLVSTQAIIMGEDVYFNEPGFEGEAGTEMGDRKNEAYSNIVRYGNIKFAMIENLKNPPKGFETVIKRHFYLKKEEILEECNQWVECSKTRDAEYTGLINDHNSSWCTEFKSSKTKYRELLAEAVKELEIELNKLQPPQFKDVSNNQLLRDERKKLRNSPRKPKNQDINEGKANLDDVDVTYDKFNQSNQRQLDVSDEQVRDRWSRYIGAMGLDAVKKQSRASVFLSGLGPIGVEISKNCVLSGLQRFTLHDHALVTPMDLVGQFFLSEEELGNNRALSTLDKLQQLNYYVKVDKLNCGQVLPDSLKGIEKDFEQLSNYDAIIIASHVNNSVAIAWDQFCRKYKIKLIVCSVEGVFTRLINDWGDDFIVVDKNGEQGAEVMVKSISIEDPGRVQLLTGSKHGYDDGDVIEIKNVVGMNRLDNAEQSINGTLHKIKVIEKSSFFIEDTTVYSEFHRNGTVKLVKIPIKIKFETLETVFTSTKNLPFDELLGQSDFTKIDNPLFIHIAYQTLNEMVPRLWNIEDAQNFVKRALEISSNYYTPGQLESNAQQMTKLFYQFALTCKSGEFAPVAAFMGGFVAQELIKSLTNKFMPVRQLYYTDSVEVLPLNNTEQTEIVNVISTIVKAMESSKGKLREQVLIQQVGVELVTRMNECKLFMVGCGAIGCELLKNFAMLNIGSSGPGSLTITDPDHIETSNLNRQFLFREKHIRMPKSQTAAAAVIQMNPLLKGRIIARLDKVFEGTENIFTDKFFECLTVVANALDNVQARRYVDQRCVNSKTPLLESGTLGPKGHVQVIIPHKTESYGSSNDPVEDGDIPYCTLKMFPEETFHCVEFARDKFGKLFTLRPKAVLKILEDSQFVPSSPEDVKSLRDAIKLYKNRPSSYKECVEWARMKFNKYFVNDIQQLLYTYPLDQKTKEGNLFWTMPKRPPMNIQYNPKDTLHINFISTLAFLRAQMFGLEYPKEWRLIEDRSKAALMAQEFIVKQWVPSEEKKQSIASEVTKNENKQQVEDDLIEQINTHSLEKEQAMLISDLAIIRKEINLQKNTMIPEEFEKDNDYNGHIDFIHSLGNLRAANYMLDEMDWLTVKLKAGRIVPALATTTSVVAGLQTIELCKILKNCKIDTMKNAFINLAIPYAQMTEPGLVQNIKLTSELTVTLWDRWDVPLATSNTLNDFLNVLQTTYKLKPVNVFQKGAPIYMESVLNKQGKEKEREKTLLCKMKDLLNLDIDDDYIDLSVNFTQLEKNDIIQGVPQVRVIFRNK